MANIRKFILPLFFFSFLIINAQENNRENTNFNDSEVITNSIDRHPNSKHFSHIFIGYGFAIGAQDTTGSDIIYGKSHSLDIGYRYKLKLSETFNTGFDIYYNYQVFHLKQDSSKNFPNNILHNKEKFIVNQLNGDIYLRIRFKKSPMLMGKFFDFGAYGGWIVNSKIIAIDKLKIANNYGASQTETIHNNLVFTENIQYGAFARLGLGHIIVTFRYRLTQLFKPSFRFADMPVYNIGIQFGLHD